MSDNPERELVRRIPTDPAERKAYLQGAWNGPGFYQQRMLVIEVEAQDEIIELQRKRITELSGGENKS